TVDQQDLAEAVMHQAARDVKDVVDERLPVDGDSAREVDVMGAIAVRDRWENHDLVGDTPCSGATNSLGQHDVGVNWQVPAMVLERSCRDDDDLACYCGLVDLGPRHLLVPVVPLFSHRPSSLSFC